jgi:hypothetical protein
LQRAGALSDLGRAVAELEKVEKMLYLLAYVQAGTRESAYLTTVLVN